MNWLNSLFFGTGVPHSIFILTLAIACGIFLSHRLKFKGITLGITWILFCAIAMSHFGMHLDPVVETFAKDFGLILFVYSIGLQVGPSFFSSFGKGGIKLNILAVSIVLLSCATAYVIHLFSGEDIATMTGILFGAVTNTPGLGAATEACNTIFGSDAPAIANGYACAYPLGVVGIIGATILIRLLTRTSLKEEQEKIEKEIAANPHVIPHRMTIVATNPALADRTILQVRNFLGRDFVCSRILHDGHVSMPNKDTIIHIGDKMFINCAQDDAEAISAFIGPQEEVVWEEQDVPMVSKHVLITQPNINGKTLAELHFSSVHGVNVTRVRRGGMNLFADSHLRLQVGDRIVVVGPEDAVDRVANKMGNSVKKLDHPNLSAIFIGIFVGIIFGSLPFAVPGVPTPVKLGLAGGPLIIAILVARFGYKAKIVAYTTTSANLMLREIGLALFLASVGIKAGANFMNTVVAGDGLTYVWCGFLITIIPILIIGLIGKLYYKINYFTLMGLIAGANTDPPALAFANQTAGNDAPAVGYSTVYPLSMFLRILTAQLIILLLCVA